MENEDKKLPEEQLPEAEKKIPEQPSGQEESPVDQLSDEVVEADEVDERFKVEKEWADRLGIDFDPKAVPPPPQPKPAEQPPMPPFGFDRQQYPQQQPPMYDAQLPPMHPHGPMPPTNMVWAIISTICCCLPFGIVAIVYSSQVSTKYFARDFEGARRASERAEWWIIASIVTGVVFNALYVPLSLMMQP